MKILIMLAAFVGSFTIGYLFFQDKLMLSAGEAGVVSGVIFAFGILFPLIYKK